MAASSSGFTKEGTRGILQKEMDPCVNGPKPNSAAKTMACVLVDMSILADGYLHISTQHFFIPREPNSGKSCKIRLLRE